MVFVRPLCPFVDLGSEQLKPEYSAWLCGQSAAVWAKHVGAKGPGVRERVSRGAGLCCVGRRRTASIQEWLNEYVLNLSKLGREAGKPQASRCV